VNYIILLFYCKFYDIVLSSTFTIKSSCAKNEDVLFLCRDKGKFEDKEVSFNGTCAILKIINGKSAEIFINNGSKLTYPKVTVEHKQSFLNTKIVIKDGKAQIDPKSDGISIVIK